MVGISAHSIFRKIAPETLGGWLEEAGMQPVSGMQGLNVPRRFPVFLKAEVDAVIEACKNGMKLAPSTDPFGTFWEGKNTFYSKDTLLTRLKAKHPKVDRALIERWIEQGSLQVRCGQHNGSLQLFYSFSDALRLASAIKGGGSTNPLPSVKALSEIARWPEFDIVRAAQNGDRDATAYLVQKYEALAKRFGKDFGINSNEDDLSQEARIAVLDAIRVFDFRPDGVFSAAVQSRMRASTNRFNQKHHSTAPTSQRTAERRSTVRRYRDFVERKKGIRLTHTELAERLGLPLSDVEEAYKGLDLYLDAPTRGEDGPSLHERLTMDGPSDSETAVSGAILQKEREALMMRFRETLEGRDLIIFDSHLIGDTTLKATGAIIGKTRSRVGQISIELKARLQAFMKDTLYDEEIEDLL